MFSIAAAFLDKAKIYIFLGLVAVTMGTGIYFFGKHEGKKQAQINALEQAVKNYKTRGKIDEKISDSTAAELCRNFGLSDDDLVECMQRLAATETKR